tara:strand:- start:1288 stop:2175 length:888 start_codon:yes stop_codon:yes gene_type:complete
MIEEEKVELIINFMNNVRSEFMGMTINYEYEHDSSNHFPYIITMNVTGKFPLAIMSFEMFEGLFWYFFYRDSKYFGINRMKLSRPSSEFRLSTVFFNGDNIDRDEVIMSDHLSERFQEFYNECTKESTILINMGNDKGTTIKLLDNKIDYKIHNEGDIINYTFAYIPKQMVLDGYPFTTKTIHFYIDKMKPRGRGFLLTVDDIFNSINNLIYEENMLMEFRDNLSVNKKFNDIFNRGEFNHSLTEENEINITMELYIEDFSGINVGVADYPEKWEQEAIVSFLKFLEELNGYYPI